MSENLRNNDAFLKLLLNTEKSQAVALIRTITKPQIVVLSEIAINLVNLNLSQLEIEQLRKRKPLINLLASRLSINKKRSGIYKNRFQFLQFLTVLKPKLEKILQ